MSTRIPDLAQTRLDNAMLLFDEFVRATVKHADAATLRGLERRFAERIQIQPSYWSQVKARSRQIGERLARQFEQLCHKPRGWMDEVHTDASRAVAAEAASSAPRDDDERFIVALVLSYYRRHPQRARTRLLDLLGEVLVPAAVDPPAAPPATRTAPSPASVPNQRVASADDAHELWLRSQQDVAPLKRRR